MQPLNGLPTTLLVWDEETPATMPAGIQRITRNPIGLTREALATAYGEGFVIEDDDGAPLPEEFQLPRPHNVVYDREQLRRIRPILFAQMYGAGDATLNRIVHQGDAFDLEAAFQHPATAEVNRNGQS